MKKLILVAMAAFAGSFLAIALLGIPLSARGGTGVPATDNRFCADANGDGRLDVSDAMSILNYLFTGASTPYCVAQGVSLDDLSAQLNDLAARLQAVEFLTGRAGLVATGNYVGDGTDNHKIETGLGGRIKSLQIWLDCDPERCGLDEFVNGVAKTDLMPGGLGAGITNLTLKGSAFVVGSGTSNEVGRSYTWLAITAASSD